jgi:hypothetical protein
MKNVLETNIDNEWTDFLMGCDREQEPPPSCYKKSQNSSLKKKITKISTTSNAYEKNKDDFNSHHCNNIGQIQTPLDANGEKHNNNNNNNRSSSSSRRENKNQHAHDDDSSDNDNSGDDDIVVSIRENQDDAKNVETIKVPTCSPIYISTKTKILFLNTPIDIKQVFWEIPIMPYASQCCGIIKKQIKFSCTTKEELEEIEAHAQKEIDKNDGFIETQIIEHIDNPEGRIKFKDHRKINIGLSKKDILNCRCKKKRAFFNCFVLIIRVEDENSPPDARTFKEMHIKVFNTGKLEIPGIQHDNSLKSVIDILIHTLKIVIGDHVDCRKDKCETVLINSNFNCGFYIDRDKLYNALKYKYRINSNYDSCSYPGIQCKFFYYVKGGTCNEKKDDACIHVQNGQQPTINLNDYIEISFMIFRTGSVLIVGKCEDYVLHDIYDFIKELFRVEFLNIYSHIIQPEDDVAKKHVPKLRTRTIVNDV